jgi:predicted P-loop ATPase
MKGDFVMENKIAGMIDEAIEEAIKQLQITQKGSPEYNQMVTNIAKLNEQRLKEAELDADATSKAIDRAMEDEKMAHEMALKNEETRQTKLKGYFDLAKSGLALVGTVGMSLLVIGAEDIGPVVSKAFSFIPRPKF